MSAYLSAFGAKADMPRGLHAPNNVRFKRCVRRDAPDDAIGAKFEKRRLSAPGLRQEGLF